MAARVIDVDVKGGNALLRHLKTIEQKLGGPAGVIVGFLEDATYPVDTDGGKVLPVAQNAFWQEYGTTRETAEGSVQHVPPRPFIRRMIASKSPRWGNALGANLRATDYDAQKALALMGEGIKDQMVASIVQLRDPPLAPSTIEAKGFDKPLIDTGVMQRAVDYQVVVEGDSL